MLYMAGSSRPRVPRTTEQFGSHAKATFRSRRLVPKAFFGRRVSAFRSLNLVKGDWERLPRDVREKLESALAKHRARSASGLEKLKQEHARRMDLFRQRLQNADWEWANLDRKDPEAYSAAKSRIEKRKSGIEKQELAENARFESALARFGKEFVFPYGKGTFVFQFDPRSESIAWASTERNAFKSKKRA